MSDKTTVKNWSYPFRAVGESGEVTDPQVYFDALARAANGFYPMGSNGLWHGGVHFDEHTAALLDQSAVRCIADGEVVAYRIDKAYPTTDYEEVKGAPYSTGFVLVRHRLALPPAPTSPATATGTDAGAAAEAPECLTFFSLYMHLLDCAGYQADPSLPRPAFWGEGLYTVKSDASDPVLGLNVRAHHKVASTDERHADYQNRLATLPRGTRIETGEAAPSPYQGWRRLVRAIPAMQGLEENTGWIYVPEARLLGDNQYLVGDAAKDVPALEQFGLNVREAPNGHSRILAVLPRGTRIKLSEGKGQGGYAKLEAISGDAASLLAAGPDDKVPGFVWLKSLDADLTPHESAEGAVYVLPEPRKIDAGELIGHMGLYQDYGQAQPGLRLHLEVFSCEDVPAFIGKSRARATSLPENQKSLLKIHKGASKLIPHRADITPANPPKRTDQGVMIGVDLVLPIGLLDSLPGDHKIQVSEVVPASITPRVIQWWRLDNLLADEAGNRISGWLAEQELITTRHSPWEWEGWDFISETTCATDQLACHLDAERLLTEAEQPDYQAQISSADHGPIKTRLYDIIDTNRDGKMTLDEIRAALNKPWHAQSISQLVTEYDSEWFWDVARWDELDHLMGHAPGDSNHDWVEEKKRIENSRWWSDVADSLKLDAEGKAWHLPPIGLLATFSSPRTEEITVQFLEKILKKSGDWFTGRGGSRGFVERFQKDYPSIYKINKNDFVQILNAALIRHGITTNYQKAHFLAQCYHESAHFETTIEFASGERYNPGQHPDAIGRGNTEMGDGPRYKGKGLIQLTWKNNYAAYSRYRGIDFVGSPDLIASDMYNAVDASCWFWRNIGGIYKKYNASGDINVLIDHEKDNVELVTLAVNGGANGLAERKEIFDSIKREWGLK